MATYNSALYAQETGQSSTAVGAVTPVSTYTDGKRSGGTKKAAIAIFDTSLQNLSINDIINVCTLPADVIVTACTLVCDTATGSMTTQLGITGTAGYFSTSAVATATAAKFDLFTNLANYGTPTPAASGASQAAAGAPTTTVQAKIAGAGLTTGKLYFLIEYLAN